MADELSRANTSMTIEHRDLLAIGRGLEAASNVLGACHMVEEGPTAGWRGEGQDLRYEDDLRCRADCPVCHAQQQVQNALAVVTKAKP